MSELTVYKQLTFGTSECLAAIKREIGLKSTCIPFAVKIMTAMSSLDVKTEKDSSYAANTLLSGLQTLMQGGIVAEDYDKIDFVKRGKTIVPTARIEAFLRAAARKGYRITDTIIAVPTADKDATYFKENFHNGDIIYTLEDRRFQPDRIVTADRIVKGYFNKFICRLDIHDISKSKRVLMTTCELSNDELLTIVNTSEQGFYKTKWIQEETKWGTKNKKVITDELNLDTFWVKWTSEMVNKTIIRRALKRVKEVLPELKDTIYAFEQTAEDTAVVEIAPAPIIELPMETQNVNLLKLTGEELADAKETLAIWKANPKLASDSLAEIKTSLENGTAVQTVINKHYASITCLKRSPKKWELISGYFKDV